MARHTDTGIIRKLQRSTLDITALRYGYDENSKIQPQFNVTIGTETAAIILSSRGALGWWVEARGRYGITSDKFSEFATDAARDSAILMAALRVTEPIHAEGAK